MSTIPTASDIRFVQQGEGPDVLLIAGLGDVAEVWQAQLDGLSDRYRVTAFDNRGVGRTPMPADGRLSIASMADDAADLLRSLGVERAHIAGFSGGGVIAQMLAVRHPELVRSLVLNGTFCHVDAYLHRVISSWRWMAQTARSEREFLEGFLTWIYTPASHESGWVDETIEEMLAYPHPQSLEAFLAQVDAWIDVDIRDRLHEIDAPALVISGEIDLCAGPRYGEEIAKRIDGAGHVVIRGGAHQPFEEVPDEWNRIVHDFWSRH